MEIKLKFLGAVQNVTGSRHLLEANGVKVLIDCGLYQERQFKDRNWDEFPVPASQIDAVLLTHAHLDHCGLLPKLVKEGFKGKIYATPATAEIAEIILLDSAKIQQEDVEHKRRRHERKKKKGPFPLVPLYTVEDAEATLPLFEHADYRESFQIGDGVEATFYDAGHVLGSSVARVKVRDGDEERILLFSGDISRPGRPIVCDATIFDRADYIFIESTYGDRVHHETEGVKGRMGDIINSTRKSGGNIIVPSFALERSQEMLYYVNQLLMDGTIEPIKIFLDSPMAARITTVFKNHAELFDEEMAGFVKRHHSPFEMAGLEMAGTADESKAINGLTESVMVIAGSGMCTGGRIKHHLVNNITNPKNTLMFVGYQAVGTLGRILVEGAKEVRILGEIYPVRARIERVHGFSAHADRDELLAWLKGIENHPRGVFVVHGEEKSAKAFGEFVHKETGWAVTVPEYMDEVVLD